ncbi:MAG TPA: heavy metal translocating P-type ATPase [Gemmatimonadales bacterium]|nr:heavy metal translocating P-type ATPase [Gemmatimonadales bacterium]
MDRSRIAFPVEGMTCGACAVTVQKRLAEHPGVVEASVNFATGRATLLVEEGRVKIADLVKAVREVGYDSAKATVTVPVEGLHYAAGVSRLETEVARVPGVLRVVANQALENLTIDYVPGLTAPPDLEAAVRRAGLNVAAPIPAEDPVERERLRRRGELRALGARFTVAALATVATMVGSLPLMAGGHAQGAKHADLWSRLMAPVDAPLQRLLPDLYAMDPTLLKLAMTVVTLPVLWWSGRQFFVGAWRGLQHRTADMNTLIAVGTGAAFLYSLVATAVPAVLREAGVAADVYFEAVNGIIALILLGRLLEVRARARTSAAIQKLLGLRPRTARVQRRGEDRDIPLTEVVVGDRLVVKPGEIIPVDGVILEGASAVSEALLTGEPMPVDKKAGSPVIGGTVNGSGSFIMQARAVGKDTALAQIIRLVEEAQGTKAPVQRLVDRVAGVFVPVVIALAIAAFVVWFVVWPGPQPVVYALVALVTVLVIACPCALGLATPTAIMVGTGKGAEHGVLIRGGEALEGLRRIDTIVFDKTGTLTEGRPAVTHVLGAKRSDGSTANPGEVLRLAAAVEARSEHPLARAVVESARAKALEPGAVDRFVAMAGRGARGIVGKLLVEVISLRHTRERSLDLGTLAQEADRHTLAGRSVVVVVINDTVQGLIVIADPVKASAKPAVERLKSLGYTVYLLSGDSKVAANLVARDVGIERVVAEVAPGDKVDEIKRLQQDGAVVAMVGDGLNDAPALAQADVGFSLGTGTDVAVEASDITLIRGDLRSVVTAIELSRRTMSTIRWNLVFAFVYNVLGIPLAAGILYPWTGLLLSPVVASAAMALSSLSVVGNSLRLRRFAPSLGT